MKIFSGDLIKWVRENGYKITGVKEQNICGETDVNIIQICFPLNQIILTHDSDFGKIIFTKSISFHSIIYLRPGHFDSRFHISTLKSILKNKALIRTGTLIIGHRTATKIKIRIKQIEINT